MHVFLQISHVVPHGNHYHQCRQIALRFTTFPSRCPICWLCLWAMIVEGTLMCAVTLTSSESLLTFVFTCVLAGAFSKSWLMPLLKQSVLRLSENCSGLTAGSFWKLSNHPTYWWEKNESEQVFQLVQKEPACLCFSIFYGFVFYGL